MRSSDTSCASKSPKRSTVSTICSQDEGLRSSLFSFNSYDFENPQCDVRTSKTIPTLLRQCSVSARNLLSRSHSIDAQTSSQRLHYGLATSLKARKRQTSLKYKVEPQLHSISVRDSRENLLLLRDDAEYSDYFVAHVTNALDRQHDGVVFYEIEVHLSKQQWRVNHRFSEFRVLRKQLLQLLSQRHRRQEFRCPICENVLASIIESPFPSRRIWKSPCVSSASRRTRDATMINDRKVRLQAFVRWCLFTVRSLRQHVRIRADRMGCELTVVLQCIEEFFSVTFARYLEFLVERGIVDQVAESSLYGRSHRFNRAMSDGFPRTGDAY
ncbi:hypothetical protein CCR75_004719 [Bremia lactucae]|uniref:PX domain-containing protein n=1 Tax=Bremia lactucae TaxID=4779 RepID=A0A976IKP7_BRELC|nr:hypothetical protein CCR75_004719 [Bremia lactucae]